MFFVVGGGASSVIFGNSLGVPVATTPAIPG